MDARNDTYEFVNLFDKVALFTLARIDRKTLPEGVYAYDLRGKDEDPGDYSTLEPYVAVNHAGTILVNEEIEFPAEGYINVEDELDFEGGDVTLDEYLLEVSRS